MNYNSFQNKLHTLTPFPPSLPRQQAYIYTQADKNIIEARSSVLEINCMLTVLCCKEGEGSKRKVTFVFEEIENVYKDKDKKQ